MPAHKSAKSSFISSIGRFRNGGLVGSAITILIGFIEAAAVHASDSVTDDVATHDHAATSSGTAPTADHAPTAGHLSDDSPSLADATHGSGHDDGSSPASPVDSSDDHGSGPTVANADSFWFNADGPVRLDADTGGHSLSDSFAALSEIFADHSTANAEVAFTSAASSSFEYSGPGILDTEPGGAHAYWPATISVSANTSVPANFAADPELGAFHQSSTIENNLFVIGAGSSKAETAAAAGASPILQPWNGDLGSGFTSAAGAGTGGSPGSVEGVTTASNGQGLVINVVYDASVANAPAGFTQTIANVVNFYESQFSNPVTITIDVGYGEMDGQPVETGALGESQANLTSVTYAQLEAALANNANAIGDAAAAASLSSTSPVDGQYWIPTAEAKALGITSTDSNVDGYAGFTSVPYLDYNVGNASGTVPGSQYDFFGVVAHEFSEIMGRQMLDGANFGDSPGYTALDLFHYSAPGVRDFSGTTPGYFSPDGGYTNLGNFNTNPSGDFGDWAASAGNNSYLAYSNPGKLNPVTASDITVMNLLGWDSSSPSTVSSSAPTSGPPTVAEPPSTVATSPTSGHATDSGTASVPASGVLTNASDSNSSDSLSVSAVNGSAANVGVGVAGEFGVLTLDANGSYSYFNNNPAGVHSQGGVAMDTFSYTVSDNQGSSANSDLTVLVTNDTYITGPADSTIWGGKGKDVLNADAGGMTAVAGSGHQWLFGGPGDTLTGGSGTDTFMFAPNFGNETIRNFQPHDIIELPTSLFANFHEVMDSMTTVGSHTVIALDATDSITLTHITAAQLHAHNFYFV